MTTLRPTLATHFMMSNGIHVSVSDPLQLDTHTSGAAHIAVTVAAKPTPVDYAAPTLYFHNCQLLHG